MFQRQVAQRVANRVVAQQQRKMGHGPVGQHLLGTKQADYIQQRNMYGELPSTPGEKKRLPKIVYNASTYTAITLIGFLSIYQANKEVRVDIEKVTVEHPDTKEPVYLFKPTGIHKDFGDIYGYKLVQAPQLQYTRRESVIAAKMALYNDEMDFWLKHGADAEKVLGRPFKLFKPEISFVTDAQDATALYRPDSL